jgi:uncharacterized protein
MQNTNTVKQYFHSLATGNFELLGSLLADDIVWHQPGKGALSGKHVGKPAVFALFGKFMEISEGSFKIDGVDSIMENGALVSASLKFSAAKKSGAKIAMSGVDLMKVENGQIKEVHLFSGDQAAEDAFWG